MLITGIPTPIPQSDVITSLLRHAAYLPFPDRLNVFGQSRYDVCSNSVLHVYVFFTDWSLGSV